MSHIEGTWADDDLRRAFVMGAKWWEFQSTGATMWPSDRRLAEEKAEGLFPDGKPPNKSLNAELPTGAQSNESEPTT